MSIFGYRKDFNLFRSVARELVGQVVEQVAGYYKIALAESKTNIYGESLNKIFNQPVKVYCRVTRGDQVIVANEFGQDFTREVSFAFLKDDLIDKSIFSEVGDIIFWDNDYYEVDSITENQLFFGKDDQHNEIDDYHSKYGASVSVICKCHITRVDKLNLAEIRL